MDFALAYRIRWSGTADSLCLQLIGDEVIAGDLCDEVRIEEIIFSANLLVVYFFC
jgi:hypothetical protein